MGDKRMKDWGPVLYFPSKQCGAEGSWDSTEKGLQCHPLPPPEHSAPPAAVGCGSPHSGDQLPGLGWAGLGAVSQHGAAWGLTLMFQLHSHLSLLLVSGTQGREVSILIFISGIGLCLLCRCLASSLPPMYVHPSCRAEEP